MDISGLTENGQQKSEWKRRNYQRLYSTTRQKKRVKIVRLGGKLRPRQLRTRVETLILRLKKLASPLRLLSSLKGAYVSMMMNLAGHVSPLSDGRSGKPFCGTHASRICADVALGNTEFEKKLVLEMIKSLVASPRM